MCELAFKHLTYSICKCTDSLLSFSVIEILNVTQLAFLCAVPFRWIKFDLKNFLNAKAVVFVVMHNQAYLRACAYPYYKMAVW
jgi:hypothetical protein